MTPKPPLDRGRAPAARPAERVIDLTDEAPDSYNVIDLRTRSHQEAEPETTRDDLVTVVIPARNEELTIAECLESVLAQDHANLQVIVVDGSSTDATAAVVRRMAARDSRVELISNDAGIIPRSLNLALEAARGRWFVRVDAHAHIPADYVRRVVDHLSTGAWGAVGGRKDGVAVTSSGGAVAAAMASRFGVGNSVYHYGSRPRTVDHVPFGAYPTEVARSIGGWDERFAVNQDYEFDYRVRQAGREILFDPALVISWACSQSISDLFRQYRRYGRGKALVVASHPRSMQLRHLAAPGFIAASVLSAAVARRTPALAASVVGPYALALAAASISTARKLDDPAARRAVPAAFLAMHVGWGIGFWEGVASVVRQRVRGRRR